MSEAERNELKKQLEIMKGSQGFLALLVFALFLSYRGISLQREDVCRLLRGETPVGIDLTGHNIISNAIGVGALIFFFLIALDVWKQSTGQDETIQGPARRNLWAALFALAAALIRLSELERRLNQTEENKS